MKSQSVTRKREPLRCRLFGHAYRDNRGRRMPDVIIHGAGGAWDRMYSCRRCHHKVIA